MDKASKKELLSIIAQQEEDLNRYRTRFQGKALYICFLSMFINTSRGLGGLSTTRPIFPNFDYGN